MSATQRPRAGSRSPEEHLITLPPPDEQDRPSGQDSNQVEHAPFLRRGRRRMVLGGFLGIAIVFCALSAAWTALSGPGTALPALQIVLVALVAAGGLWPAIVDARTHRLPNELVAGVAILVAGGAIGLTIAAADPARLAWAVAGGVALSAFYLLGALAGLVGLGDVKLALPLGVLLSWWGWQGPIQATVLAFLLSAPQAIAVLAHRQRGRRLAFGPYMIAAAALVAAAAAIIH